MKTLSSKGQTLRRADSVPQGNISQRSTAIILISVVNRFTKRSVCISISDQILLEESLYSLRAAYRILRVLKFDTNFTASKNYLESNDSYQHYWRPSKGNYYLISALMAKNPKPDSCPESRKPYIRDVSDCCRTNLGKGFSTMHELQRHMENAIRGELSYYQCFSIGRLKGSRIWPLLDNLN